MYGIGKISGAAVASWRLMFLITGAFTIVFGALFLFIMPVSPVTAWFLKPKEREIAHARLQVDRLTDEHLNFDRHQLWEALMDPKVWCIFVLSVMTCVTSFVITVSFSFFLHLSFTFKKDIKATDIPSSSAQ